MLTATLENPEVQPDPQAGAASRRQTPAKARQNVLDGKLAALHHRMDLRSLGHANPGHWRIGDLVAVENHDLLEVTGESTRREQPANPRA